ncbi:MAG: uroporphyrinogen-III C-methyltransferase [Epulopiscium sp. Nuni2H_MBin003]|nr:MAG: uroporphyrinogen-III C-methyltransferase [Epulopiscium sp. Nuni2H_MBin003]
MQGKVYLVGAGPGDIGLLTIKAKELLQTADVIVYDALVGDSILATIDSNKRCINVGKRAAHHIMQQEDTNKLLLDEALKGNKVVRLKGGDPFLFGRGGEELELLVKHKIDFEVVPGVTSAISGPAYNGIPVTHRDYCSSIHIITGHKKQDEPLDMNFEALVKLNGTLIFLMGISSLEQITTGLIKAGMDKDMPAAVLQQATTSHQKKVVATISTLREAVVNQAIRTPAIIVVGKVCKLSNDLDWYSKLPLFGYKVAVSTSTSNVSKTATKLRKLGAEVIELPSITTTIIEQNRAFTDALRLKMDWIAFTSPQGVESFFYNLEKHQKDIRTFKYVKFAVVGPSTKAALAKRGIIADLMPDIYDGASLAKALKEQNNILLFRATKADNEIVDMLSHTTVYDIPMYDTHFTSFPIIVDDIDCIVFTSASSVEGFVNNTKWGTYSEYKCACIGEKTKECADKYGFKTYVAKEATIDELVQLVIDIKERTDETS